MLECFAAGVGTDRSNTRGAIDPSQHATGKLSWTGLARIQVSSRMELGVDGLVDVSFRFSFPLPLPLPLRVPFSAADSSYLIHNTNSNTNN